MYVRQTSILVRQEVMLRARRQDTLRPFILPCLQPMGLTPTWFLSPIHENQEDKWRKVQVLS